LIARSNASAVAASGLFKNKRDHISLKSAILTSVTDFFYVFPSNWLSEFVSIFF
jgi:hypothetical protein